MLKSPLDESGCTGCSNMANGEVSTGAPRVAAKSMAPLLLEGKRDCSRYAPGPYPLLRWDASVGAGMGWWISCDEVVCDWAAMAGVDKVFLSICESRG